MSRPVVKDPVLEEARRLYRAGFAIIWLHKKSKRPVESGWTTGARTPWVKLEATYRAGYNVGVRTGTPSKFKGGYLACIDVDIKDPDFYDDAIRALNELTAETPLPEVRSGSGNGSRHLYCRTAQPFRMITVRKEAGWEICIYSDGRQMVLPPSIHPDTGKAYRWEYPLFADGETEIPLMDFAGVENVSASANKKSAKAGGKAGGANEAKAGDSELAPEGSEAFPGFKVSDVDLDWLPISPKVLKGIKDGSDIRDRSAFLLPAVTALHSAGLSRDEVLSVLTDRSNYLSSAAYDHAQTRDRTRAAQWLWKYTVAKVYAERSADSVFSKVSGDAGPTRLSAEDAEKQTDELLAEINWRQYLDRSKQGKLLVTLKNLDLIFAHAVEGDVFIKDLFANRVMYGDNTPWGGKKDRALEDIDLILVKRWLADAFGIEPNTSAILEATSLVGHKKRIHPVRDWLESLEWDGVSRIDTWIKEYCEGQAEEPYLSQVSRKFILAMVKRIFEPGCQWDYVLVLEGKQGRYKSSIARALAGDRWFMDNLPDLKDKDAMLNLQGKWLIELGELTSVKRSDYNLVKAYLVRRTDTVRPHYGRIQADVPRQSVFIGTVNEGQYLKDPTGNRRYWPVKVGHCDVKGLTGVRDQLFAEAMHIYRETGEILMLDETATSQASEAQEDRRVDDDESEMKSLLLEYAVSEAAKEFDFNRFRIRDLFTGNSAPWGSYAGKGYAMNTAASVLISAGFEKRKIGGERVWGETEIWRETVAKEEAAKPGASPLKRDAPEMPQSRVMPQLDVGDFL